MFRVTEEKPVRCSKCRGNRLTVHLLYFPSTKMSQLLDEDCLLAFCSDCGEETPMEVACLEAQAIIGRLTDQNRDRDPGEAGEWKP